MRNVQIFGLLTLVWLATACANDNLAELSHTGENVSVKLTPSFSHDIQPIIKKYQCVGCHGNDYYIYPGVKSLALSGELVGTMSGVGYKRMPPTAYGKVTTAELETIKNWITQGESNN
jgi:hypothetical protein